MKKEKSGSILVFVLALIVLLSVLCMRLMEETMQELRHVSQFHRRDDLECTHILPSMLRSGFLMNL